MSNVFANGREISGKSTGNKSIASMPDVCLSPPSPPAGPIPIPYPNTAVAGDTADGSKTVKIGGKEASLKNSSVYKKSNGNEPATNSFGANVITHKLQGASHFAAWSSDVKIEGQNAPRHMDLTTHNHANPGGGAMGPSIAGMAPGDTPPDDCTEMKESNNQTRSDMAQHSDPNVKPLAGPAPANAIARASVSGAGGSMLAASRHKVLSPHFNGMKGGLKPEGYPGTSKNVCPDDPYTFSRTVPPGHYHAEARLLESVPLGGGRPSVTIAINWQTKKGVMGHPCQHCERLIKHACKCMDIYVCDAKNNPKSKCS